MKTFARGITFVRVQEITLRGESTHDFYILSLIHKLLVSPRMLEQRDIEDIKQWLEDQSMEPGP